MTAKEYLRNIRTQEFRLRSLEEAIMVLETKATKVTQSWSDMPVQHGGNDGVAGIIIKIIDTKNRYAAEWDKLIDDRKEAEDVLAGMTNTTHSALLWLYYIRCKGWSEVSERMGFSESYVLAMHGIALKEFEELMKR